MIELTAGELRLVLDPETGGAIASLTYQGTEILRPVADPRLAAQGGRAVAGYPLIPFANRVAWGRFTLDGQTFSLKRNFGDHPHTIHGNAWMHRWRGVHTTDRSARLIFDHRPTERTREEWPFAYHAEQLFSLTSEGVSVTLSVQNMDRRAWPAGLGLHPYVARSAGTRLRFEADTIWSNDDDSLPAERTGLEGDNEFDRAREVSANSIDNCYAGWGGETEVTFPGQSFSLGLEATPPFDHLQVYTPEGQDFMGLEPVSNMPDAINRTESVSDNGLRMLKTGEILTGQIKFRIDQTP